MRISMLSVFSILLLLPLIAGCAGKSAGEPGGDPQLPYPPERQVQVGDILHMPTGLFVEEAQMLDVVTDARIAYVGETHDNPASHRLQLSVIEAMAERYPGKVALGLEMMTPEQQQTLDRWVAGELSEKELLKESGWYEQWRMDFGYYRDIFLFAREQRIPIVGLNAPKELVRELARKTPEELTEEQRAQLPEMDLEDPYQRGLVKAVYGGHMEGESGLEGFLRVQVLWDEYMAQTVASYLAEEGEEQRMVVLAGGNHIRHGFGIPRRVFRRLPTSYVLVGSREVEIPQEKVMDIEVPEFPILPYDFVAFVRYEELERVRLGVMLEEAEEGVRIKSVLPGSAAEEAGLRGGDLLLSLDGDPIEETLDVIYAVRRKSPGDKSTLRIEREGEVQELEVRFRESEEESP